MIKNLSFGVLCAGIFFSSHSNALTYNIAAMSRVYKFAPGGEGVEITNSWFRTIKASCVVKIDDTAPAVLQFDALHKSGSINEKPLSEGMSDVLTVVNNSVFTISAASGAKVNITNHGSKEVTVDCTLISK